MGNRHYNICQFNTVIERKIVTITDPRFPRGERLESLVEAVCENDRLQDFVLVVDEFLLPRRVLGGHGV